MIHTKLPSFFGCRCYIIRNSLVLVSSYRSSLTLLNLQIFRTTEILLENHSCRSAAGQTVTTLASCLSLGLGCWMKVTWLLRLHTVLTNMAWGHRRTAVRRCAASWHSSVLAVAFPYHKIGCWGNIRQSGRKIQRLFFRLSIKSCMKYV